MREVYKRLSNLNSSSKTLFRLEFEVRDFLYRCITSDDDEQLAASSRQYTQCYGVKYPSLGIASKTDRTSCWIWLSPHVTSREQPGSADTSSFSKRAFTSSILEMHRMISGRQSRGAMEIPLNEHATCTKTSFSST